jgi:hypothetical protein
MAVVVWTWLTIVAELAVPVREPLPIVGGDDVGVCEWPSTVAFVLFGAQYCSATLVHPELVIAAAHCIHPASGWGEPEAIAFGEDFSTPARTVAQVECQMHPMYDPNAELNSPEDAWDLAWCRLEEPVTDVAVTPILAGCETDQAGPGTTAHIVGFGALTIDDGGNIAGNGIKRHTVQSIEAIDDAGQYYLVGDGTSSACSGDSGGSAYVQLADGSWRALGALARNHPDAPVDPPYCQYGVVLTGATIELPWLESSSGLDLTPCFDDDGAWDPTAECDAFPLDPIAAASWDDGCAAQPVSDLGAACGPAFDGGEDTGGTSEGGTTEGSSSTGTAATSTSDGGTEDDTSTGAPPADSSSSSAEPQSTSATTSSESGDTTAGAADGDSGCGCRSSPTSGTSPLLCLYAWLVRRRRQPTSASATSHGPRRPPPTRQP